MSLGHCCPGRTLPTVKIACAYFAKLASLLVIAVQRSRRVGGNGLPSPALEATILRSLFPKPLANNGGATDRLAWEGLVSRFLRCPWRDPRASRDYVIF